MKEINLKIYKNIKIIKIIVIIISNAKIFYTSNIPIINKFTALLVLK